MRRLIVAVLLLTAAPALAQQPPPSPEMQALQSLAMEAIQARLSWQSQAITLQAQLADLQKQLAAAKAKETPK